jgi:hypothetical protein
MRFLGSQHLHLSFFGNAEAEPLGSELVTDAAGLFSRQRMDPQ